MKYKTVKFQASFYERNPTLQILACLISGFLLVMMTAIAWIDFSITWEGARAYILFALVQYWSWIDFSSSDE